MNLVLPSWNRSATAPASQQHATHTHTHTVSSASTTPTAAWVAYLVAHRRSLRGWKRGEVMASLAVRRRSLQGHTCEYPHAGGVRYQAKAHATRDAACNARLKYSLNAECR